MVYSKPVVLAQNGKQGIFAAGCPEYNHSYESECRNCFRAQWPDDREA